LRGLPWTRRENFDGSIEMDDHVLCTSDTDWTASLPGGFPNPRNDAKAFSACMKQGYSSTGEAFERTLGHAAAFPDDLSRATELCVPLDLQEHWKGHWQHTTSNVSTTVSTVAKTTYGGSGQVVPGNNGGVQQQQKQRKQTQKQHAEQDVGQFDPPSIASRSRHCVPGAHSYNGIQMQCVKQYHYCPAEQLGALRNGVCRLCAGKEAVLSVPRTPTPTTSTDATVVCVPCPAGFRGNVSRTCGINGWVDQPLAGGCVRKRCAPLSVAFDATKVLLPYRVEGSGPFIVPCPEGYTGNISAVCAPDAEEWSSLQERCRVAGSSSGTSKG